MRFFLVCSFAAALMIYTSATRAFAQEANNGTVSSLAVPSYPDSPEGLQNLVEDAFGAIKSGDKVKASAYCSNLVISDHMSWFVKVFGPDEGSRLDARYRELLPEEPTHIRKLFETALFHGRTNLKISVLQKPVDPSVRLVHAVVEAMSGPIPLYSADGENPKEQFPVAFIGIFVYVDGGFRYLDTEVLGALSTAPPLRIRVGANVLASGITFKVSPVYPDESRASGIKGVVVLHVIIGINGTVKEAALVSGDPVLGQSALDAVRQWRYRPTLLNSKPVEVDSTVTVELGWQ